MSCVGKVQNGVVVLPEGAALPDGTFVRVQPVSPEELSLADQLLQLAGKAVGLPDDLSRNLDHYLHGQPRHD